jgi:hypothetical protein
MDVLLRIGRLGSTPQPAAGPPTVGVICAAPARPTAWPFRIGTGPTTPTVHGIATTDTRRGGATWRKPAGKAKSRVKRWRRAAMRGSRRSACWEAASEVRASDGSNYQAVMICL